MYKVIKRIKGIPYLYEQSSKREGGKVRTSCRYIGPASSADVAHAAASKAARSGGVRIAAGRIAEVLAELGDPAKADASSRERWNTKRKSKRPFEHRPELLRLVQGHGLRLQGASIAAYNWTTDEVMMPPPQYFTGVSKGDNVESFYATLFHELAHWSGHSSRLNRHVPRRSEDFYIENYAREELIAEATAVLVLDNLGYKPKRAGRHALYFQHYLRQVPDRDKVLAHVTKEARRAAEFLLNPVNTTACKA